jgi:hypothetical protein
MTLTSMPLTQKSAVRREVQGISDAADLAEVKALAFAAAGRAARAKSQVQGSAEALVSDGAEFPLRDNRAMKFCKRFSPYVKRFLWCTVPW